MQAMRVEFHGYDSYVYLKRKNLLGGIHNAPFESLGWHGNWIWYEINATNFTIPTRTFSPSLSSNLFAHSVLWVYDLFLFTEWDVRSQNKHTDLISFDIKVVDDVRYACVCWPHVNRSNHESDNIFHHLFFLTSEKERERWRENK